MNSNSRYAGRCVNVPACGLAAQGRDLIFEPGQPAVCPSCGSPVEILGVAWNANATTEQRVPQPSTLPPPPVPGGSFGQPPRPPQTQRTSAGVWVAIATTAVILFGLMAFGIYKTVVAIAMTPGVLDSPSPDPGLPAAGASPDPGLSSRIFIATTPPQTASSPASSHSLNVKNATGDTVEEIRYAGPGSGFGQDVLGSPIAAGDSGASYRSDDDPCTVDVMATIGDRPVYEDGVDICTGTLTVETPDPNSTDPTVWHYRKDVLRRGVPEALTPE